MHPVLSLVLGVVGGVLLCFGADFLVRGGAALARAVGVPTLGFEWDVGWGLMRTTAKGATLHCNARDHYYPLPLPKAKRPVEWDLHVRDWADREIGFSFEV